MKTISRKYFKVIFTLTGLLLMTILPVKAQNKSYSNPTPGKISIVASSPIPDGVKASKQSYKDLIDCGFNVGLATNTIKYFQEQFKIIDDLDFKYILHNGDLFTDKRIEYVKAFKGEPHFGGWKFLDEPSYVNLPKYEGYYEALYKADPSDLIYINLVGMMVKQYTADCKTYLDYLKLIQKKFKPEVWSYDFYPIKIINNQTVVYYDNFYSDFEDIKTISQQTNRPFWAYCESMAYYTNTYSRPEATEAQLRWEAFTALAYGAQGIVYWTYGQRQSNDMEHYTSALVNMDGKKTKAWYAAKNVNEEIKRFNDVFYQCNVKDLKHTGKKVYSRTKKLKGAFGPFKSVKSGDAGVVVSLIENSGRNYVVIVNRDVLKAQSVSLEVKASTSVDDITTTHKNTYSGGNKIDFNLDPGAYRIFQF